MKNAVDSYKSAQNHIFELLCKKPYSANRNHVEKWFREVKYNGKFIAKDADGQREATDS